MRGMGIVAGIGLALTATVAQAQWDVSIMPMSSRAIIDFKDQFNNSVTKGQVGVAVALTEHVQTTGTLHTSIQLRYSYQPPTGGETILTSPPRLIVSGVDFSSSSTQPSAGSSSSALPGASSTQKEETVYIEWIMKPAHLLELEVGFERFGIVRPLVVIDHVKGGVTATMEKQGKLQTATEDFSGTFVGFGARARSLASKDLWVDAGIALGSGYERAEVSANMQIANNIFIVGGYRHRVMRFNNEVTVRRGDVFGEVGVRF